eukprot:3694839-Pyramimonas_sp.AAC.1
MAVHDSVKTHISQHAQRLKTPNARGFALVIPKAASARSCLYDILLSSGSAAAHSPGIKATIRDACLRVGRDMFDVGH